MNHHSARGDRIKSEDERGNGAEERLRRARLGDEAALRLLYEEYRPRVLRLAYALLGSADDAEDVMQDVMVYALTHLDRYDAERAAFPTWLHLITVSRCRDRLRRERLGLRRMAEWLHGAPPDDSVSDGAIGRIDASVRMRRALARLTPVQREAIVLREVEGLSYEEIGQVLGVPMRTAQARVTSAHAALRRLLIDWSKRPGEGEGNSGA